MAVRGNPSAGGKPDKMMRDALMLSLKREAERKDENGMPVKTKRLYMVADALVDCAIAGDVQAIKEINDRVDGRVPQALVGDSESPITVIVENYAARRDPSSS